MSTTTYYKDWELVDVMPEGYHINRGAGSPLSGHVVITNSSLLNDGKEKLLKVCAESSASSNEVSELAALIARISKKTKGQNND